MGAVTGMGFLLLCDEGIHLGVVQMVFALIILAAFVQASELALSGGVIHERNQAHPLMIVESVPQRQQFRIVQFATQVEKMFGARIAFVLSFGDGRGHVREILQAIAAIDDIA